MSFVSYFGTMWCLKVSQHATGSKQAPKLSWRSVTLCSTLNFGGEDGLCCLHILFILLLFPAAPNRLPPMAPSRTPPNAIETGSTVSWTSSPACCPSPRRSGLGWTSCRCCASVSATWRSRASSTVSPRQKTATVHAMEHGGLSQIAQRVTGNDVWTHSGRSAQILFFSSGLYPWFFPFLFLKEQFKPFFFLFHCASLLQRLMISRSWVYSCVRAAQASKLTLLQELARFCKLPSRKESMQLSRSEVIFFFLPCAWSDDE